MKVGEGTEMAGEMERLKVGVEGSRLPLRWLCYTHNPHYKHHAQKPPCPQQSGLCRKAQHGGRHVESLCGDGGKRETAGHWPRWTQMEAVGALGTPSLIQTFCSKRVQMML